MTELLGHSPLEFRLLNDFQREFPLLPRPFLALADALGSQENTVLETLNRLRQTRVLSRIGPVFRPHVFGASTLAAMAVPEARLTEVAAIVSARPEVNHNYQREHQYNLWFVVTAQDAARVQSVLAELAAATGLAVLDLPLLTSYHIDLGFRLDQAGSLREPEAGSVPALVPDATEQRLIAVLQDGLPLVPRTYAAVADAAGWTEATVIERLRGWLDNGQVRRLGVVVQHRKLGFRANGMAVWNVSDADVDRIGQQLARYPFVTLCYRRRRQLPDWPYNLFCMLHGRDRGTVEAWRRRLIDECRLHRTPTELLFSTRCFKQRGARYYPPVVAEES